MKRRDDLLYWAAALVWVLVFWCGFLTGRYLEERARGAATSAARP